MFFGIASLAVVLSASVPYIIEIVKKRVQPERISWLLWSALAVTYFVGALKSEGAILMMVGELVAPLIIFVLSLKYGVGGKSLFDRVCLGIAAVSFILLLIVDSPLWGLVLALSVDLIGMILTVRKLLKDRASEPRLTWALFCIASTFGIFSLEKYTIETLIVPVYLVVA